MTPEEVRNRGNELLGKYRQLRYEFWKLAKTRAGKEFQTFQSAEDWWEDKEADIEEAKKNP